MNQKNIWTSNFNTKIIMIRHLIFLVMFGLAITLQAQTKIETTRPKQLSDSALLDLVQKQTFRYFWDFAHPVSGMARERSNIMDLWT